MANGQVIQETLVRILKCKYLQTTPTTGSCQVIMYSIGNMPILVSYLSTSHFHKTSSVECIIDRVDMSHSLGPSHSADML